MKTTPYLLVLVMWKSNDLVSETCVSVSFVVISCALVFAIPLLPWILKGNSKGLGRSSVRAIEVSLLKLLKSARTILPVFLTCVVIKIRFFSRGKIVKSGIAWSYLTYFESWIPALLCDSITWTFNLTFLLFLSLLFWCVVFFSFSA